jgi:hypothetical protein
MYRFRALVLTLACAMATPAAFAANNLVLNGDFDTGNFSNWIQSGETDQQFIGPDTSGSATPHAGNVFADGAYQQLGYISQAIATTPGAKYTLTFDLQIQNYYGGPTAQTESQAWFGNTMVFEQTNIAHDWVSYTISNLKASGASTVLKFGNQSAADYNWMDNVTLVMTAVPEPDAALMFTAGLTLLAWTRRRRA